MSDAPLLLTRPDPAIALITFNLPKKLNALTADLYRQLAHLLNQIAQEPEVLVTIITGKGRYFSAGADFARIGDGAGDADQKESKADALLTASEDDTTFYLRSFAANNLYTTRAFAHHPKLLVVALNGPAIGLSAALTSHADFLYAVDSAFLMTPFTSLGLVAEGGSSLTFVQRLGLSRANAALILSQRLGAQELLAAGYLNKILPTPQSADRAEFVDAVLAEVKERFLGAGLNRDSMLKMKALVRSVNRREQEVVGVEEAFGGMERFMQGVPQREFAALAAGTKKHKL